MYDVPCTYIYYTLTSKGHYGVLRTLHRRCRGMYEYTMYKVGLLCTMYIVHSTSSFEARTAFLLSHCAAGNSRLISSTYTSTVVYACAPCVPEVINTEDVYLLRLLYGIIPEPVPGVFAYHPFHTEGSGQQRALDRGYLHRCGRRHYTRSL